MTYKFTDDMDEISGFGGGYEDACRKMVIAGLEWLDAHEGELPQFHGWKGVTGIIMEDNQAAKDMTAHMNAAIDNEATGAMMQFCVQHAMYAKKNGWDKYCEIRRKKPEHEGARH